MPSHSGYQYRSYSTTVRDKTLRSAEREADPLLPGYNDWGRSNGDCPNCGFYSFLKTIWVASTIFSIFGLFLLPSIIAAWRGNPNGPLPLKPPKTTTITTATTITTTITIPPPPPPPPPPPQPFEEAGLNGYDVPIPGSVYIITEANSSRALTYNGNEGVTLDYYHQGLQTQRWNCHEADGWLGFAVDPGQSTCFLGYSAWPSPPVLRCSARTQDFKEMFVVSKLPEDGFRMGMRDSKGLKPVGRDSRGMLAMVGVSDVWWRFTKV